MLGGLWGENLPPNILVGETNSCNLQLAKDPIQTGTSCFKFVRPLSEPQWNPPSKLLKSIRTYTTTATTPRETNKTRPPKPLTRVFFWVVLKFHRPQREADRALPDATVSFGNTKLARAQAWAIGKKYWASLLEWTAGSKKLILFFLVCGALVVVLYRPFLIIIMLHVVQ